MKITHAKIICFAGIYIQILLLAGCAGDGSVDRRSREAKFYMLASNGASLDAMENFIKETDLSDREKRLDLVRSLTLGAGYDRGFDNSAGAANLALAAKLLSQRIDPFERYESAISNEGAYACREAILIEPFIDSPKFNRTDPKHVARIFNDCIEIGNDKGVRRFFEHYEQRFGISEAEKKSQLSYIVRRGKKLYSTIELLTKNNTESGDKNAAFMIAAQKRDMEAVKLFLPSSKLGNNEIKTLLKSYEARLSKEEFAKKYTQYLNGRKVMIADSLVYNAHDAAIEREEVIVLIARHGVRLPPGDEKLRQMMRLFLLDNRLDDFIALLKSGTYSAAHAKDASFLSLAVRSNKEAFAMALLAADKDFPPIEGNRNDLFFVADDAGMQTVVNHVVRGGQKLPNMYQLAFDALKTGQNVGDARYWLAKANKFASNPTRQKQVELKIAETEREIRYAAEQARIASQNVAHASSSHSMSTGGAPVSYVSVDVAMVGGGFVTARKLTLSGGPGTWNGIGSFGSIQNSGRGVGGQYSFYAEFNNDKACSGTVNVSGQKQMLKISVYSDCRDAGTWEN